MNSNPEPQDILFFCEFQRIAWGEEWFGIFINRGGEIYRFGQQEGMSLPSLDFGQSHADYLAWVSQHAVLKGQVNLAELDRMTSLIEAAAQGTIVGGETLFDAGDRSYLAFYWQGRLSQEILLVRIGEGALTNQSPEAAELVSWLNGVWSMW